jgi:hypothetical protein
MILGQAPQQMAMAGPAAAATAMPTGQAGVIKTSNAMIPQPSMQVPQTGLIGSEQALMGGQQQALGAMGAGNSAAQGYLQNIAGMQIQPSQMLGSQAPSVQGVSMGQMAPGAGAVALSGGGSGAYTPTGNIGANYSQSFDKNIGADQINQGVSGLDPYASQGGGAIKMQADLSGANGQAAQQAAYEQYQSSPAMQYQMDQMQRSTERSAAAKGGLLGGNVALELQRNASGIASQDYQNQFNNLGSVANTGLNAAAQQGNLLGQQAQTLGSLEGQRMGNEASVYGQQISSQAQLAAQAMQTGAQQSIANAQMVNDRYNQDRGIEANLIGQQYQGNLSSAQQNAQIEAGLLGQRIAADESRNAQNAQLKSDAYSQLANLAQANGLNTAGLLTGTAQQLSQGRTQAGQAMAQNATQAASQIADKLAQSGLAVSDTMARDISTMTDMIYQSGMQDKIDSQQLATILANISGGQASTVAQGYSNIGSANAAGTLGVANAVQGGITQAIGSGLIG